MAAVSVWSRQHFSMIRLTRGVVEQLHADHIFMEVSLLFQITEMASSSERLAEAFRV